MNKLRKLYKLHKLYKLLRKVKRLDIELDEEGFGETDPDITVSILEVINEVYDDFC